VTLDHDLIVLATPLGATAALLQSLAERAPRGLIFDLGSLKTPLRAGLHALVKAGCRVTSVHPMFGPDTELLSGRHVIFIDLGCKQALAEAQELFAPTMAERVVMDLDEHDRLIAYVLGLSHALNIAFFTALADSGEAALRLAKLSSTTFDSQLEVASRVAAESPELYYEIQSANEYGGESLWPCKRRCSDLVAAVRDKNSGEVRRADDPRPRISRRARQRAPANLTIDRVTPCSMRMTESRKRRAQEAHRGADRGGGQQRDHHEAHPGARTDAAARGQPVAAPARDGGRPARVLFAGCHQRRIGRSAARDPPFVGRRRRPAGGVQADIFRRFAGRAGAAADGAAQALARALRRSRSSFVVSGKRHLKSTALVPLPRKDRATGALCFASRDPTRFTRHHATDFLAHLGAVAAVCIENAVNRARLLRAGITDFLTGWHNRRYLQQRLKEELARAQRRGGTIACLMIDIDRFKSINDGYGHLAGDAALKEVAHRVEGQIRSMDTAARFGGDELAILLPETTQAEAATWRNAFAR
jgi:prephenate dehydrogenase